MKLEYIIGTWFIVMSNFPMWLKGDKIHPTFNYSVEKRKNISGLCDEVRYEKLDGKIKTISGWDKPLNTENTHFQWRGKGLMSVLTSNWEILFLSENKNWALIHFKKTLFTPQGYDVISRNKSLTNQEMEDVKGFLQQKDISTTLSSISQ